jgi:hypothetical protein
VVDVDLHAETRPPVIESLWVRGAGGEPDRASREEREEE